MELLFGFFIIICVSVIETVQATEEACVYMRCQNGGTCISHKILGHQPSASCQCDVCHTGKLCETSTDTACKTADDCPHGARCLLDEETRRSACACHDSMISNPAVLEMSTRITEQSSMTTSSDLTITGSNGEDSTLIWAIFIGISVLFVLFLYLVSIKGWDASDSSRQVSPNLHLISVTPESCFKLPSYDEACRPPPSYDQVAGQSNQISITRL